MAREVWEDPRTIVWVDAQPFHLRRGGAVFIVDGEIAIRHHPWKGSTFDLFTSKRLPIIREGRLSDEEAVRRYIEHNPENPEELTSLNYDLRVGAYIIVGGYRIRKDDVPYGGLHLGVAAAHQVSSWEVNGRFDPIHASRKERARMRF